MRRLARAGSTLLDSTRLDSGALCKLEARSLKLNEKDQIGNLFLILVIVRLSLLIAIAIAIAIASERAQECKRQKVSLKWRLSGA